MYIPYVNKSSGSSGSSSTSVEQDLPEHGQVLYVDGSFYVFCSVCLECNPITRSGEPSEGLCRVCYEYIFFDDSTYLTRESFDFLRPSLQRSVPAPRLVGVEPNPGPTVKLGPSGSIIFDDSKKSVQNKGKKGKKRRNRKRQKAKQILGNLHPMLRSHYRNVLDPFGEAAVLHRFDTPEAPQQFNTVTVGTGAMNADGSGSIFVVPNNVQYNGTSLVDVRGNYLSINSAAQATSGAYTSVQASNRGVLVTSIPNYKVVSCGLRVTPLVAQTSAPGIIYGDQINSGGLPTLNAYAPSTNTIISLPGVKRMVHKSGESYIITWCPDQAFEQEYSPYTAKRSSDKSLGPILAIAFSGFPASTNYLYEVIVHGEGYLWNDNANGLMQSGNDGPKAPALSDVAGVTKDILYNPPKDNMYTHVNSSFRNPYSEIDEKHSTKGPGPVLSQISDIYEKGVGALNTASQVVDWLSSF